jgi:flagellar basal-body rod protein FlgB
MVNPVATSLERYMDLLTARQKLISSNIANADTPGYRTRDLDFESELRRLTDGGAPQSIEVSGLKSHNDGNNVSMDREARLLSETALRFNAAAQLVRGEYKALKSAIDEGRGA